ncbi:MAG: endonuclease [Spirochaetes bacterium]|nr:endonuclease [Spirochaetota bacterium]
MKKIIFAGLVVWLIGCITACTAGAPAYEKVTGENEFSVLTYNVAGLPEGLSSSHPQTNMPLIAPKLNNFDIVLVQEDFAYHINLQTGDDHPYETEHDYFHGTLGDGLNAFSYCPFTDFERITWDACNGYLDAASDCLTPKGFTFARHEIADGVFVDIYDLHMDAGSAEGDLEAREIGMTQLINYVLANSAGNAVLIGGDWNLGGSAADVAQLERILNDAHMTDSCRYLACGQESRIDRILFRSSDGVILTPTEYAVETELFKDEDGNQLSDHEAVSVLFKWQVVE